MRINQINTQFNIEPQIGCIQTKLKSNDYGYTFEDKHSGVKVFLSKDDNPRYGQCYSLINMELISNQYNNPSSFDYKQYMRSKQISYQAEGNELITSKSNIITKLKDYRYRLLDSNCHQFKLKCQYQKTLLLGENLIENETKKMYGRIGIGPLLAISGMHISFGYNQIIYLLSKLRIVITKANWIAIVLVIIYSVLAGNSVSVNRAVGMLVITKGFKQDSKSAYAFCLLSSLIINPLVILNVGFQLSYVITLFFIILGPKINSSLLLSFYCYLIALPLSHSFSYTINLLAPIAMLFYSKIIFLILIPLSIANFVLPLDIISKFSELVIVIIESLGQHIDKASLLTGHIQLGMWIVYYLILIFIYRKSKNLKYLVLWFTVVSCNITLVPSVNFIDVGQGDSTLIKARNQNILIDAGEDSKELSTYLAYYGISQLDKVIISHGHTDHYAGLLGLSQIDIKNVYELAGNQIFENSITIDRPTLVDDLQIIPYNGERGNDKELIVLVTVDGISYLFPGDSEIETEQFLVNNYCQEINVDVLKVPHHGSKSSSSQAFIDCVDPQVVIISSGIDNDYGHPHREVIERLQDKNLYNTQNVGEIKVKNGNVFSVKENNFMILN